MNEQVNEMAVPVKDNSVGIPQPGTSVPTVKVEGAAKEVTKEINQ